MKKNEGFFYPRNTIQIVEICGLFCLFLESGCCEEKNRRIKDHAQNLGQPDIGIQWPPSQVQL